MRDRRGAPILSLVAQRTIGQNITAAREAVVPELSQSELARRIGKPAATVNSWEADRYNTLSLENLVSLAAAIPCPLETLVRGVFEHYDRSRDLSSQRPDGSVAKVGEGRVGSALPSGGAIVTVDQARVLEERNRLRIRLDQLEPLIEKLFEIAIESDRKKARKAAGGGTARGRGHRKAD